MHCFLTQFNLSVSPEEYSEHFTIENDTGVISVKKQLDKEKGNTINITITVRVIIFVRSVTVGISTVVTISGKAIRPKGLL